MHGTDVGSSSIFRWPNFRSGCLLSLSVAVECTLCCKIFLYVFHCLSAQTNETNVSLIAEQ